MTTHLLEQKIIRALADAIKRDPAKIRPEDQLREDLGLDSLAVIELLFKLEETFDLQIPDQDLPTLTTVGSVVTYIQSRVSKPRPPARKKSAPKKTTKPRK